MTQAGSSQDDPLGLGGLNQDDPFDLGEWGADLPGQNTSASTTLAQVPTSRAASQPKTGKRRSRLNLRDGAGWVAICFGGYQAITAGYTTLKLLPAIVGSPVSLVSVFALLPPLFLVLGIWLALSGFHIVRRANPRDALDRAAQASMVYIALFALGMALSLPALIGLSAVSASLAVGMLVMMIVQAIYIVPPAFIVYVNSRDR